jgi:hypothetical protein
MQTQEQKDATLSHQDILLKEYESLVSQMIHWDSHFWVKSQFFLVIESAFVAVILQAFKEQVTAQSKLSTPLLFLFLFAGLFNIYLCYVWFRTNRRNREYLRLRFERARQIESELGVLQTFTDDSKKLPKGHGSAAWETHLPTGFIVAWVVLLIAAVVLTR